MNVTEQIEYDEAVRLPLWRHALDALEKDGMIQYGQVIPLARLENLLRANRNSSQFAFQLIGLRDALRYKGYFCTLRGMNNDAMRILEKKESFQPVKDSLWQLAHRAARNAIGLGRVSRDGLAPTDTARLDRYQTLAALTASSVRGLLLKRKLPTTPDMKRLTNGS